MTPVASPRPGDELAITVASNGGRNYFDDYDDSEDDGYGDSR